MQTALLVVFIATCIGLAAGIFWRHRQKNAKFNNEIHQSFAEFAQERRRKNKPTHSSAVK